LFLNEAVAEKMGYLHGGKKTRHRWGGGWGVLSREKLHLLKPAQWDWVEVRGEKKRAVFIAIGHKIPGAEPQKK